MTPGQHYLQRCRELIGIVERQQHSIAAAAEVFAASILSGRMVHVFGSGHSRIMVEEMWPRYGSFPGFNPLVELSLTFHNPVVGCNGQRQAMHLENTPGLAERILRNFDISQPDSGLVISSSGCNVVPVEMAAGMQRRGLTVVAIVSLQHALASTSRESQARKLHEMAAITLDTGAPVGDAMVPITGWDYPVSPGSTVGGCLLINAVKAEVAQRLAAAGAPARVLTAPAVCGSERSEQLFEAAYDEHARRLARLFVRLGLE